MLKKKMIPVTNIQNLVFLSLKPMILVSVTATSSNLELIGLLYGD
jgi:hypothetical protein